MLVTLAHEGMIENDLYEVLEVARPEEGRFMLRIPKRFWLEDCMFHRTNVELTDICALQTLP